MHVRVRLSSCSFATGSSGRTDGRLYTCRTRVAKLGARRKHLCLQHRNRRYAVEAEVDDLAFQIGQLESAEIRLLFQLRLEQASRGEFRRCFGDPPVKQKISALTPADGTKLVPSKQQRRFTALRCPSTFFKDSTGPASESQALEGSWALSACFRNLRARPAT